MDQRTCSVNDCEGSAKARGWCGKHYARWRNNGSPEIVRRPGPKHREPAQCEMPECDRRSTARKMCQLHYSQWRAGVLASRECLAEGCTAKARESGFCGRHRSPRVTAETSSGIKRCSTCDTTKQLSEFHRDYRYPDRRVARCKPCTLEAGRDGSFRKRYGVGLREVEEMREAQGGQCATCANEGDLCVDHDHETGAVRQLLCRRCNVALGQVEDDPELLHSLIDYLGRHRTK